jgi:predicted dehydrogenase
MKKVRYGVIGIKGIGELHYRLAQQHGNVELTALADVDAAAVRQKAEALGVRGFTDYRNMIEANLVDAVSIATPHHLHAPIALDCLRAGLHVFVEKPIANRISEADKMVEVAKAKNLKLCVGHQYRTFRSSRVMKHLIETGAIGNVMRVLWTWGDFRSQRYFEQYPWKSTWQAAGGGVLAFFLSHDLDTICWLIGRPVQVSALIGNQLHDVEVDDIVCANVLFENGVYASVQATLNHPGSYSVRQLAGDRGIIVIQDAQSLTYDHGERILLGTYENSLSVSKAKISEPLGMPETAWRTIDLDREPQVAQPASKGWIPKWVNFTAPGRSDNGQKEATLPHGLSALLERFEAMPRPRPHGLSVLMDSFIDAILNGGKPAVTGESALCTLELMNAIVLSAIRKKTVDLPLDREEYDALFQELCASETQIPRFH